MTPETEIRSDTRTGVAVFAPERQGRKLLVAYLADDRTGELLGAGSHQDFDNDSDEGTKPMLRFKLAETTQAVRVRAVYGDEDDAPLYTVTKRLPPT